MINRRGFLLALPTVSLAGSAIAQTPASNQGVKITDVKVHQIRLVKDLGHVPASPLPFSGRRGGETVLEIFTDSGLSGIAPGIDPASIDLAKHALIGNGPFPLGQHIRTLSTANRGSLGRNGSCIEIALWDLIGKIVGQPLYNLWGGTSAKIAVYSSVISRGTSIEERVEMSRRIKADGWRAIKLRPHWENHRDDVRLVEQIRKAVGEDFMIMCDANMASGTNPSGVVWDHRRATETALAYQALGVEWLEEPLPAGDLEGLAALHSKLTTLYLAGGELQVEVYQHRDYITQNCYDIVQPELMLMGPTQLLQVSALAEAFRRLLVPHEGFRGLGTICQLHYVAGSGAMVGEILNDPPIGDYRDAWFSYEGAPSVGTDGFLTMSSAPGLGVSLRRDLIASSS
jgi:D-galactarolactone cycloisomerase